MTQSPDKLNQFAAAMIAEAQAQADEILREAQAQEKKALDEYEAELNARYAEKKAAADAAAALDSARALAAARLKCRRELLEERESCARQAYDAVRARLAEYTAGDGYGAALAALARAGAVSIPGSGPLTVYLRAEDLPLAPQVTAALDAPVKAVLPGSFLLGGVVLDRPETHRRVDLSYDSALLDLQGRFSDITGFDVEARHGN